ncbi:aldehyde dehydrogenase family protein [Pontibacter sp. G13]|uniref:L-piperidine-6-carboxylate dehydrogenase n=1 Tax=Pontibacter sp. G13 TaxID=3074898 RepID=UPI00288922B8|nr:aldehyde dehydrogenase family protein [Pontibacter sp. G13]WNJ21258.1 aldehyde dehydrogenase family protein [Pontibacter sp. G13]
MDKTKASEILEILGIQEKNPVIYTGVESWHDPEAPYHNITAAADGQVLGSVQFATESQYEMVIQTAQSAFLTWREVPAPQRGEIVRQIGEALRKYKEPLGALVSLEMGKIYQEGLGEVQEMIDICDFAVGLSRQLYGLSMHSERKHHRMYEQWHPLGTVGIISAFNFPVAVWAWNSMIAAVCGNTSIWKPSEKTPLTAVACMNIVAEVIQANDLPEGIFNLVIGDRETGEKMANDKRLPLISATGSTRMGKSVGEAVGRRLGKTILELGGNNAIIITPHANLKMAIPAILFGAVGTCGQRCTSTRRLIIHEDIYEEFKEKLVTAYQSLQPKIGHPLDPNTLIGPLIDQDAVSNMQASLKSIESEGGNVLYGGEVLEGEGFETGTYVMPALVEAKNEYATVQHETFAPILYLMSYGELSEAVDIQNGVPQGLSSSIFTENMRESERFLSMMGSDCGIANVNIGTSGAEIGGAFGGEKETGGGRESGSDAWKAYMRRQTNTINWSEELPLAQGIKFDI